MNSPSNSSTQKTLNRRPEARGFRIEQLLQEASDGKLRVPSFQRPLRWRSKQVVEFFDSIRRGFPIGDLLLSRDVAPSASLHFGPHVIESPSQSNALWVIDGQQRITSLVACLLRKDLIPKGDFWATWYDLDSEKFVRLSKRVVPPSWIPLNVLCNSVDLLKWIRVWSYGDDNPDLVDRALELGKAIREYEVPAYIVEGADESLVRLIFTRVNSGGIRMRESEIFEARYGKEGDKPIRTAVARLTDMGFGEIDADLFLRCLRSTCEVTAIDSVESPEDVDGASIVRTERAIRRAVFAIQNAAGIPHWKLLPYRMPLIFLSAFFDRFPEDNNRVDRLAARWLWHGALSGDHYDSTDASINRLLRKTLDFTKADEAIANLLSPMTKEQAAVLRNNPVDEIELPISMNRASGKAFVLGLLAAEPKLPNDIAKIANLQLADWDPSSEDVYLDWDELLDGEIEGADSSKTKVASSADELKMEKLLLPLTANQKLGTDVVIKVQGLRPEMLLDLLVDDSVLKSHLLDREAIKHLIDEDHVQFRAHRKELLKTYFASFVNDRIGDETDLRPSIKSIAEGGTKAKSHKVGTQ